LLFDMPSRAQRGKAMKHARLSGATSSRSPLVGEHALAFRERGEG